MQVNGSARTLILRTSTSIARMALVGLVALSILACLPHVALANDSIGTGTGDLFHSKSWIRPEIYQKPAKSNDRKTQVSATSTTASPTQKRTKTIRKRRSASKRKRKVARVSSSKLRQVARLPVRKKERSTGVRRVPPGFSERLARAGRTSADLQHYAIKVASLGIDFLTVPKGRFANDAQTAVTGGDARINWVANRSCLSKRLQAVIRHVALNFASVRVNSTCRSRRHNRRVGGARRSWHLKGRAADIRVFGNIRKAARYLRRVVGGYKHYGGGLFHIDTGPRRRW